MKPPAFHCGYFPGAARLRRVPLVCYGGGGRRAGFTLLELLVAMAVLMLILALAFSAITQTSVVWQRSTRDLEAFQGARRAFENITRLVSQATLNTYWDYEFDNTGRAVRYRRNSDLHFYLSPAGVNGAPGTPDSGQALFFQAPYGRRSEPVLAQWTPELLNEIGFYVEFGSNASWLPAGLGGALRESHRYRLFQTVQPTEDFSVYSENGTGAGVPSWISTANAYPIADNIIALVVLPGRSQPDEAQFGPLVTVPAYDSRAAADQPNQPVTAHQLPPFLQIAVLAIDERSAARLTSGSQQPAVVVSALQDRFRLAADFRSDLAAVEQELIEQGINCRVFVTRVQLKESKWSE